MAASPRGAVRVRRSPHLVVYWRGKTLVACNYATGARAEVPPRACELLSFCDAWTALDDVKGAGFVPAASFAAVIARMVSLTLLERSDRPADPRSLAMEGLRPWNPQVGFFHATTKDVRFASKAVFAEARSSRRRATAAGHQAIPGSARRGSSTAGCRRPVRTGAAGAPHLAPLLVRAGRARRAGDDTCALGRRAAVGPGGRSADSSEDVAVRRRAARDRVLCRRERRARPEGRDVPLRAGSARARAASAARVPLARMRAYVPGSEYFANASAMVFFTAIFARILWSYPYARAYRAALIEAGHVCQTFCLTATRLRPRALQRDGAGGFRDRAGPRHRRHL